MGAGVIFSALALLLQPAPHHNATRVDRPVWPAAGTITSPFGRDGSRWHPGIDIGTLRSLRVRAAVPGRVILAGRASAYEGYGNVVVVRSRRGLTELYGHLASVAVHRGERVTAGEPIAIAGCTGWCTGTHLHFEVRRGDQAVSPLATLLRPLLRPVLRPPALSPPKPSTPSTRSLADARRKPDV